MYNREIARKFPKALNKARETGTVEEFYRIVRRLDTWGEDYEKCTHCAGHGGRILTQEGFDRPITVPNTSILIYMIELSLQPDNHDRDLLGISTCLNCSGEAYVYTSEKYITFFHEVDEKEIGFGIKKVNVPDNYVLVGGIHFHKASNRWESHT